MNLRTDEAAARSAIQPGYRFQQPSLLEEARTHPSAAGLAGSIGNHNQRLEFLGDAVLGFLAAEHLFRLYPALTEGAMTTRRARLVRGPSLIRLARHWDLPPLLLLGEAEERQGGRHRENALEDLVEAYFGAVYLDGGMDAARQIFGRALPLLEETDGIPENPKGALQEWAQAHLGPNEVTYAVLERSGPDHRRHFRVEVSVGSSIRGEGEGGSIKEAETQAALSALEGLPTTSDSLTTPLTPPSTDDPPTHAGD